jgi:uncharacterized protein YndB with AHSA1/START domain
MKIRIIAIAAVLALSAGTAHAEVKAAAGGVIRLENRVVIAATPDKVWVALGQIGTWWNGAHSYSQNAANMTMSLTAGGCFCESLPKGGGVKHGEVVLAIPGRLLRLSTALGPLQDEGASGALTFTLKAVEGGTEVTQTYNVGGLRPELVGAAPMIDAVVAEQLGRLKSVIETGKPK